MLADETEHVQSQQSVCLSLLLQALWVEQTTRKNLNIEVKTIKFRSATDNKSYKHICCECVCMCVRACVCVCACVHAACVRACVQRVCMTPIDYTFTEVTACMPPHT